MVPLDKAMTSFYRLSLVTMSLSATVWPQFLNAKFLLAANHLRAPNRIYSDDCSVRYSIFTVACMGLHALWEIAFCVRKYRAVWSAYSSDSWVLFV